MAGNINIHQCIIQLVLYLIWCADWLFIVMSYGVSGSAFLSIKVI